jgi:Arc/MetJ-type ribon-helix-helix transcriptional regulator
MKISVSISEDDVAFLDAYARERDCGSRSAAVHQAVRALREAELPDLYAGAWAEWERGGEAEAWEPATGDGI